MSDPEWSSLHAVAAAQDGHFTTAQTAEAGVSRPVLAHPIRAGRFLRIQRGTNRRSRRACGGGLFDEAELRAAGAAKR